MCIVFKDTELKFLKCLLIAALSLFMTGYVFAQEHSASPPSKFPGQSIIGTLLEDVLHHKADIYSGLDLTQSSYFGYTGATWAPFQRLDEEGVRLRLSGGTGRYVYDGSVQSAGEDHPVRFHGEVATMDFLLGYQFQIPNSVSTPVIAKIFGGAQYSEHMVSPEDINKKVVGEAWGAKGQVELWWSIHEQVWISADFSYASSFDELWSQVKIGYRPLSWLSIGPEFAAFGNEDYKAARAGSFLRAETKFGDITLSGGVSGSYKEEASPYMSLAVYSRF